MRELLGDEAHALLAAIDSPRPPAVRLNRLKGDLGTLDSLVPWQSTVVPWCAPGRVVAAQSAEVAGHPLNDAGAYYQQDPAAMAVAEALAPRPGEIVVDVAAAPGGKATHAAAIAGDAALVIANDIDQGRARSLLGNLERMGVTSSVVTHGPVDRLAGNMAGRAHAVLLDAPCSGEGMFRRSQAARREWSPAGVERHAQLQRRLIAAAAELVAPGGRLVYSTCTFDPRENEEVVSWLLERRPDFSLQPLDLPGTQDAARFGLPGAARVWPHVAQGDGHFVARLARGTGDAPASRRPGTRARAGERGRRAERAASAAQLAAWRSFAEEHLSHRWRSLPRIEVYGGHLLAVPESFEPLPGVHVLRAGLHIGDVAGPGVRSGFEPAHALAMAAGSSWTGPVIEVADRPEAIAAYRAGGVLPAAGGVGVCLVTYRGLPLGFARGKGGEARSLLPRGLRRQA